MPPTVWTLNQNVLTNMWVLGRIIAGGFHGDAWPAITPWLSQCDPLILYSVHNCGTIADTDIALTIRAMPLGGTDPLTDPCCKHTGKTNYHL